MNSESTLRCDYIKMVHSKSLYGTLVYNGDRGSYFWSPYKVRQGNNARDLFEANRSAFLELGGEGSELDLYKGLENVVGKHNMPSSLNEWNSLLEDDIVNNREPKLSQTDFVNRGGGECPWCGSGNLDGYDRDFNGNTATLEVGCLACDRFWLEEYKLTGYREIK